MITRRLLAVLCVVGLMAAPPAGAEDLWPSLSTPPKSAGGGEHDAAVIVGAENYFKVERVAGARQNADDWQSYLTGTLKVPADRVALLLDDDATADQIRAAAAEKAGQVGPGGTLWFVFIGHGAPSKDGKDGLLVGIDAQQKTESVYARSLSRNELLSVLSKGKQAKTVVLLDSCFSGKSPSGQALVAGLQPLLALRALPQGIDSRVILMTAGRSDQFAGPLPGGSRPAFSYLALGALRGWAADAKGAVTASGLVDYARKTLSLARDRRQTPELATPAAAETVLGIGRESGPDLARLQRAAAGSSGGGFAVTDLPPVPAAEAPKALDASASGLDFRSVDVEALKKYDAAFKLDGDADADPKDKAAAWRKLAADAPQLADVSNQRATAWELFVSQREAAAKARRARLEARDADWKKLGVLLELAVIPRSDKERWSSQFAEAYLDSPGLNPSMARALARHLTGAAKIAFKKTWSDRLDKHEVYSSPKGEFRVEIPKGWEGSEHIPGAGASDDAFAGYAFGKPGTDSRLAVLWYKPYRPHRPDDGLLEMYANSDNFAYQTVEGVHDGQVLEKPRATEIGETDYLTFSVKLGTFSYRPGSVVASGYARALTSFCKPNTTIRYAIWPDSETSTHHGFYVLASVRPEGAPDDQADYLDFVRSFQPLEWGPAGEPVSVK